MSYDVYLSGEKCGFISLTRQGLYTKFFGEVDTKELSRVYGVFDGGELLLGVPVPEKGKMVLRASMPSSRLPTGRFLRGELRVRSSGWLPFPGGTIGEIRYPQGQRKGNVLRFSWKPGDPLPADELLLFYRFVPVGEQKYLELRLNEKGMPIQEE